MGRDTASQHAPAGAAVPAGAEALRGPVDAPVVVGVDGSELALAAVRLAAREAAALRRTLRIVHVFNWSPDPARPPAGERRVPARRVTARATAAAAEAAPGVSVTCGLVEGPPVTTLLRESGAAVLLAIGDGGLGRCACVPLDATALQITARAGCTVLVARPTAAPTGPVLVGVDGSSGARLALDFAFDTAARRGADLLAVRAWDPVESPAGTEAGVTLQLAAALEPYQRAYPSVRANARVVTGDPKTVLMERSRSAQLVVTSARGEQPWRGMLGAVSQALLYHSPAPTAVVRHAHGLYVQA
jgi:nucleotide-binding universal stress UspA family protein